MADREYWERIHTPPAKRPPLHGVRPKSWFHRPLSIVFESGFVFFQPWILWKEYCGVHTPCSVPSFVLLIICIGPKMGWAEFSFVSHTPCSVPSFVLLMICIGPKMSWAEFSFVSHTGLFDFTSRFLLFSSPKFFCFDLGLHKRISWSTHGPVGIVFCLPNEFYCFQEVTERSFFRFTHRPCWFHRPHSIALELDFFCFDLGWNKRTSFKYARYLLSC